MDEEFYRRQRELMGRVVAESDVVITTAAVPGKKDLLQATFGGLEQVKTGIGQAQDPHRIVKWVDCRKLLLLNI